MNPEQQIARAEEAKRLLESELFQEAFETLEQEWTAKWMNSQANDEAGREKCWLAIKMLHKLKGDLRAVMETSKIARAELNRARNLAHGQTL